MGVTSASFQALPATFSGTTPSPACSCAGLLPHMLSYSRCPVAVSWLFHLLTRDFQFGSSSFLLQVGSFSLPAVASATFTVSPISIDPPSCD